MRVFRTVVDGIFTTRSAVDLSTFVRWAGIGLVAVVMIAAVLLASFVAVAMGLT